MSILMKDLDPAFKGAGQKNGLEIWRIENFNPVPIPTEAHGKFFTGDSYIVLKTTVSKSGSLRHDLHYWLGKDTSQDESGTAAIKTVELDAALGGRAVQYREVQGRETDKFLSYFKPCIIPQEGGVSSGFKHTEEEEHKTRLFVCRGKHTVQVKEVPFARSSLNHDDIFILDTKSKLFQFNGSKTSIQERAKALEVLQYIKDIYHDGKCDIASVEDGKLMADAEAGEFWALFGGFAPMPRKTAAEDDQNTNDSYPTKLLRVDRGRTDLIEVESLTREVLKTDRCYIVDCGLEVFVWIGKATTLEERKSASKVAEELVCGPDKHEKTRVTRVMEGFETVPFRSKFNKWPQTSNVVVPDTGRGKVAALLRRQGVDVKGLVKTEPEKEQPDQPHIDCTGDLQVWRVNGLEKILLSDSEQSKFYSGDCYIFQYSYSGGSNKEDYLIGTWFGKKSVEEDQASALSQANKMVESLKFFASQARLYEGSEPIQFFAIFQSFIVFKGGLSDGYKKYIEEQQIPDETYKEDSLALFRVQGSGPENMQAIQVDLAASSLNSSYCFILQSDPFVYIWTGGQAATSDQELVERQIDAIKPDAPTKTQKEGTETEQFWELLGGKTKYSSSKKIRKGQEGDPHLFCCSILNEDLKVTEIHNFDQDDLMAEDIFILDSCSAIYVWIGQEVNSKKRKLALTAAEKFVECDFLMEKLSREVPVFIITEGSEPPFFTRFFTTWDASKVGMQGNSFQRKLAIMKNGGKPLTDKPKRRAPVLHAGRSKTPEKPQRSRSVSSTGERPRVRGRSPVFIALAAKFENPNPRNLSTPPPMVRKVNPKAGGSPSPDSRKMPTTTLVKSSTIAAITSSFEKSPFIAARDLLIPRTRKLSEEPLKPEPVPEPKPEPNSDATSMSSIKEDVKEDETEDEESLTVYPYDRVTTTSDDPAPDVDVTKREAYLSSTEFKAKFGMSKEEFYKLPKWKQNKFKIALHLF